MARQKYLLLIISMILGLSEFAHAQNFKASLRAGFIASQVSGDELSGFHKLGITGGAFASLTPNDKITWEMGLQYIQKGSRKVQNPAKGDYSSYLMALQYMEVPVMVRFNMGKFSYGLGPSFGALVGSKEENQIGALKPVRPFKDWELSGNLSISYNLGEKWMAEWRYNTSLLPVREHSGGQTFRLNRGQYHSALMIMLGYRL
ncbi:MAG: PorT family protein [Flavobacteriales bacterium]|nr:PorT family protein [Flavobacteriales bacterium]